MELEIKIYGLLTMRDSTTTELADTLAITPRSLKEHVRKLNDFAEDLMHVDDLITVDFKGNYGVNPEREADKDKLFGYLKMAAYETNTKFQVVLALILQTTINKNTLAKRLYISSTRVSTLVNQLNEELAPWEIQIASHGGVLAFAGRELCIRLYSYVVLADAFQALRNAKEVIDYESPFTYKLQRYTRPKGDPERFEKSALMHLQRVMNERLTHHDYLDEVGSAKQDRLRPFLEILMDNYDVSHHISQFLTEVEGEQAERERLYFNFFVRILFADAVPEENKRALVTKLLLHDDYYAKIAMRCVLYLQEVGFLEKGTDESFDQLTYFLALHFVYFDILGGSSFLLNKNRLVIPDYEADAQEGSAAKDELWHYLQAFITERQIDFPYDEQMAEAVLTLVVSSVQTREAVSMRIFIQTNFEMAKKALIVEFLTMHFHPEALEFVDEYSSADLIVTDNIGEFPDEIPVLFFKSLTSREQWTVLTNMVQDILIKKTLYR